MKKYFTVSIESSIYQFVFLFSDIDDCSPNPCLNGGSCTDKVADFTCMCRSGFSSKTCSMADLGISCADARTTCKDTNVECATGSICICRSSYYDDNGFAIAGTCRPMSNLRVSNVGFSSIQTDNITVTWAIPQNYRQYINRFKVIWRPTNNVNTESAELASNSTSYTMTRGIDPGRAYTVTIISINDRTQLGSSRSTSVVRYQSAKPSITSGIDDSNSDKDISGGSIKVAWINAPGYKSGYIVVLKDGETVKFTRTVNGVSVTLSSSGLKNGYNYDVTIQAKSEQFDNGKTELGEIFTSEFKTTPKSPEPPINGECKYPTDSSISLDWEAPINPNGHLVQYNIHVYKHDSLVFNNVTSTGTRTDKTIGNLELRTFYTFKIYTVNEVGQSTSSLQITSTNCKTKAKMSAMPENLQITYVTSRSLLISWDKPVDTFSDENYGYVLQVKDEQVKCKEEVLYRCSDCTGSFPTSKVSGLCSLNKQPDFYKTSAELASQLSYNASLNPDINYIVTVTAINDEGRGHPATLTQRTKEEAPQTPYNVKVVGMTATTFDITWSINGPRPGLTTYIIMLTADVPAESMNFTATGFALREYKAFGLQEYWNYSVALMASTSIGSSKSAVTNEYRTSPAAPGKVSEFSIEPHPDEDFTKMKISWEMPTILDRNGVIKSYRFENYEPGNVTATTNFQQNRLGYIYTKTVLVEPEEQYTFKVFAINEQNMEGEHIMVTTMAPAGVPLNIEESLKMDVIDLQREKTVTERQITITLVREFFEESTNGKVQTTGLVVCVNSCDFEGVMTIIDVNAMENWTGASKKGLTSYRATKSDWLDRANTQCSCGRNKRKVTNIEYIVGIIDFIVHSLIAGSSMAEW
ncbi:phosphatidylinositol phosphatase PTPRQ-like [Ruditapes philippinarum]|uniref:phosphatidylinositol phosphatase PTPRQ-like n=1 Tax=Ruditapes philippinarum TaxID=129788 RepID=UPI00295BDAA5|nr:phosphatidylinositol phosphatase PTPRQ-like [Ruditapes philippinarum]